MVVGKKDGKYFVSCANLIAQNDVDRLSGSLSNIQHLAADGLKALYKETLKGDTPEGSKGAGVGFIDIARKASHGFEFDFANVDDNHS
ncbi:SiaB family protein kinase [Magnetovibrio blakemorei]|uniref:SiaB family protein kinase n=1 Tax=Magnetovibrio blakemorei TaxID=28181 RepID=UPI001B8B977F|nr:SiaB family protein kinase [Magnetovibrio blakemorei]